MCVRLFIASRTDSLHVLCNASSVFPQHARTRSLLLLVSPTRPTCNPEWAGDARAWLAYVRTRSTGPCDLQARSLKLRLDGAASSSDGENKRFLRNLQGMRDVPDVFLCSKLGIRECEVFLSMAIPKTSMLLPQHGAGGASEEVAI